MKISQLDKRQMAKDIIKAGRSGEALQLSDDPKYSKAAALALVYEEQLGIYRNNCANRYLKGGLLKEDDVSYNDFLKSAMLADILEVSYEFYVKAQFYWFDKWFKKAPKPYHLASCKSKFNAKERVKLYAQEVGKGLKESKIYGPERTQPVVTKGYKFLMSYDQLSRLMNNYNATEEDILRVFCKGGQGTLYFDKDWLNSRPIYHKLKEAGEI